MTENRPDRRIAFILGSMNRGGAERVVSHLANHYADLGWQVDVLVLLFDGCAYELRPGVRLISLAREGRSRWLSLPAWVSGIRRYLRKGRPETVLVFAARIIIIAALANLGLRFRMVVSERNDPAADGRSLLVRLVTSLIYPHMAKVVFQTRWAQSCFGPRVRANSCIIPNPVDVQGKAAHSGDDVIVAVGRLEPQKNHHLLLEAFKQLRLEHPGFHLKIFGEGSLRGNLEEEIRQAGLADFVELPGLVDDIHQEMAKAKMFVLSSDYEGLSNALLEALQMGLPCISTDCAGSNEVLKDRENGLLVPTGDAAALGKAMLELAGDPELSGRLAAAAAICGEEFRVAKVIRLWDAVLDPHVSRGREDRV